MGKNNGHWHRKPQRPGANYKPPYSEDILNMSVEGLNLSSETLEILMKGGVKTVGDILCRRRNEMFKVQNFNKKKLLEVTNAISPLGVDFRPDEPKPEEKGKGEGAVPQKTNDARRDNRDEGRRREDRLRGEERRQGDQSKKEDRRQEGPRKDDRRQGDRQNKGQQPIDNQNRNEQNDRDHGKKQNKGKQDNSVDFSKIFPREKLVHSPRIEMAKDRFTKFQRAGKWGYKDENGKEVIPPIYTEALNFKEDMAAVEMNGLFGYINRENVLVVPYKYDAAGSFSEGWANVALGEKCGYIDMTGKEMVPFIYDAATPFTGEGYARVKKDGRWGNITKNGEVSWQ